VTLNSRSFGDKKLDNALRVQLAEDEKRDIEYARIVLKGLVEIYGHATNTGDKILNLILGRTDFPRNAAINLVMGHEVYNTIVNRGYIINLYWEFPDRSLEGLTMQMSVPESKTSQVFEKLEEANYYAAKQG
jgi:hypothetical protein